MKNLSRKEEKEILLKHVRQTKLSLINLIYLIKRLKFEKVDDDIFTLICDLQSHLKQKIEKIGILKSKL